MTVFDGDAIIKDSGGGKYFYDLTNLKRNAALAVTANGQLEPFRPPSQSAPENGDASLQARMPGTQASPGAGVKSEGAGGEVRHALRAGFGLWDEQEARTTGNARLVGLAATMLLAGREEGLAEKLSAVGKELECDITAEEAIAKARALLTGEAAARARKLLRSGKAREAAAEMGAAAQRKNPEDALMAAMERGCADGAEGARHPTGGAGAPPRRLTGPVPNAGWTRPGGSPGRGRIPAVSIKRHVAEHVL